jgi:SAM-dependent methyltransferase
MHAADDEIIGGDLTCAGCGAHYPVRDGIADFLGPPRPPTPAQITNELPPTAWIYERGWRPFALSLLSGESFPYRRELPLIAGLIEPQRGGLYLDVAYSNGLYARALARMLRGAPGHVAGFDHSMPMLKQARRYARQAGLRISYVRAKAQALPVVAYAAAGVVIGGSLNEIGDLDTCLAEVRRTLAGDGRYLAMTLARAATPAGRMFHQLLGIGGIEFWTPEELSRAFSQRGLWTVSRWKYGLVMFHLALPV